MKRLESKVVLVTGGALGIGRSACLLCAREGAKVAVTDILEKEGREVVDKITKENGIAEFWKLDVSNEKEVEKVVESIVNKFDKIDVLVNNAGIAGANKPTHQLTSQDWDEVMDVNVKGVFYCTKYVIPVMQKNKKGSIINLSSIYGLIGNYDVPPYHASKGAVRLMTKNDALIYAKDQIRVNSVHPGFIMTPMVENYLLESGDIETGKKMLGGLHPLGFIGEPEDIGYSIVYLASDESRFITGTELIVDGGYTAK